MLHRACAAAAEAQTLELCVHDFARLLRCRSAGVKWALVFTGIGAGAFLLETIEVGVTALLWGRGNSDWGCHTSTPSGSLGALLLLMQPRLSKPAHAHCRTPRMLAGLVLRCDGAAPGYAHPSAHPARPAAPGQRRWAAGRALSSRSRKGPGQPHFHCERPAHDCWAKRAQPWWHGVSLQLASHPLNHLLAVPASSSHLFPLPPTHRRTSPSSTLPRTAAAPCCPRWPRMPPACAARWATEWATCSPCSPVWSAPTPLPSRAGVWCGGFA